jgi:hypothetical protein
MLGRIMLTGMTEEQPMIHSAHLWRSWKNISKVSAFSGLRKECCTEVADVETSMAACPVRLFPSRNG